MINLDKNAPARLSAFKVEKEERGKGVVKKLQMEVNLV